MIKKVIAISPGLIEQHIGKPHLYTFQKFYKTNVLELDESGND